MNYKPFDLEERLIDYSARVIIFSNTLPVTKTALYLSDQIVRSSTSPALNYGEARNAVSRNDFIHKMEVCLKELRESCNGLKIIQRANIQHSEAMLITLLNECNELISIFVKSMETATKRKLSILENFKFNNR